MYDHIAGMYLSAAQFKASVERRCFQRGEWVYGTFAYAALSLKEERERAEAGAYDALLRAAYLVRVARQYFRTNFDFYNAMHVLRAGQDVLQATYDSCNREVPPREIVAVMEKAGRELLREIDGLGILMKRWLSMQVEAMEKGAR